MVARTSHDTLCVAGAAGCVTLGTRQAPDRTIKDLEKFLVRPTFLIFMAVNFSILAVLFLIQRELRESTTEVLEVVDDVVDRSNRGNIHCARIPEVKTMLPEGKIIRHRLHAVVYGLLTAMVGR